MFFNTFKINFALYSHFLHTSKLAFIFTFTLSLGFLYPRETFAKASTKEALFLVQPLC